MREEQHFGDWLEEIIGRGKSLPRKSERHYDEASAFGWRAAAEQLIVELTGPDSTYLKRFRAVANQDTNGYIPLNDSCVEIVVSLRDDFRKGRLASLRHLVTADVFSDFLSMADHLIENGYHHPAASLVGAVLERGLQDIARTNGVPPGAAGDLTGLANRLAEKGVYNRLVQKNLSVWIAVRNHADHGEFHAYTLDDVKSMASGVATFLAHYGK